MYIWTLRVIVPMVGGLNLNGSNKMINARTPQHDRFGQEHCKVPAAYTLKALRIDMASLRPNSAAGVGHSYRLSSERLVTCMAWSS